jgi:hypothetical protein
MNLEGVTEKNTCKSSTGKRTIYFENVLGEIVSKVCSNCEKNKCITDFSVTKRNFSGRKPTCKECDSDKYKKRTEGLVSRHIKIESLNGTPGRKCYGCRKWKKLECFHKDASKKHGKTRCKICTVKKSREWQKMNPDKVNLNVQRRKALKYALPYTLTADQYENVTLKFFGNSCAFTAEVVNLEIEHAIPISIGHGGTTFENCYPMASGLNQSKGDRNIFEWFEANRQRFELSQERFDRLIEWLASANAMTVEEYRNYVYWCHANPRTIDEINEKNESEAI